MGCQAGGGHAEGGGRLARAGGELVCPLMGTNVPIS